MFFVEVACISIAKATEETNLPHPFQPGHRNYSLLNKAIFEKCRKKTTQCSDTGAPTLLAVGTFHFHASIICMSKRDADMLLTGETSIGFSIDETENEGNGDVFQITKLAKASFLKPAKNSICEARTSLSGVLLCGFGIAPQSVFGILHPLAVRPFTPAWLPNIPFGEVRIDHDSGQLNTVWPGEAESENEQEEFVP